MKTIRKQKHKSLSQKIVDVLFLYTKTQLLLVAVVTMIAWMILSELGVQFALVLAFVTGAASVIPIIGMTVAGIIVSAVAIFDTARFLPDISVLFEGFAILVIYVLLNIAIDYFLSPYLIGKSVGLSPLMLLVCILIGTFVFGIWGALLTVPVILVVQAVARHYE
ncbi:MAG: AI-2E family transporter [Patescibacteria group bacterium]